MLKSTYDNQVCSIASALELVGERWTLLILRDVFLGIHRFDDLQKGLGVARNVLTDRLAKLVEAGILEKRAYQERPERFEYRLTAKGNDLWPVLHSMMLWGDRHTVASPDGAPTVIVHRGCGGSLDDRRVCDRCGEIAATVTDVEARPGPGATPRHPLLRRAAA